MSVEMSVTLFYNKNSGVILTDLDESKTQWFCDGNHKPDQQSRKPIEMRMQKQTSWSFQTEG